MSVFQSALRVSGIILVIVISTTAVSAQDMYNALKHEHNARRFGIGIQAFEPTGINIQMFKGFFCSNSDSYATYGVWELGVGVENMAFTDNSKQYKDGLWHKGGVRGELNYLLPLYTLESAVVLQAYVGLGVQTGSRNYVNATGDQSTFATGGNLLLRIEAVTTGFEAGNGLFFLSLYVDAKFYKDFTEDFQYFKPSMGIRIRKGR